MSIDPYETTRSSKRRSRSEEERHQGREEEERSNEARSEEQEEQQQEEGVGTWKTLGRRRRVEGATITEGAKERNTGESRTCGRTTEE